MKATAILRVGTLTTNSEHQRRGFTLIEMAVVILILGAAAAVVLPRIGSGAVERARLRATVAKMASVATCARNRAATMRQMHALQIDVKKGEYRVTNQVSDSDRQPTASGLGLRRRLPDGMTFTGITVLQQEELSDDVKRIRFSPEGWADAAVIWVTGQQGNTASLVISGLSGRIETYASQVIIDRDGLVHHVTE